MYCNTCGKELEENLNFCNSCGIPVKSNHQQIPYYIQQNAPQKSVSMWGVILTIAGAIGTLFSIITIAGDLQGNGWWSYYDYTSPLSDHETTMIAVAVISVVALIGGIIALFSNQSRN